MNKKLLALAGRIHADLVEIGKIVERVLTGWERAKQSGDDYYLDSVGTQGDSSFVSLFFWCLLLSLNGLKSYLWPFVLPNSRKAW